MQHRGYHAPHERMQGQQQNINDMPQPPYNSLGPQQRARNQQSMALDPNAFHRGGFGRPFMGRGGGSQQLFNPNQPRRPLVLSQSDKHTRQVQYLEQVAAVEIRNVEMSPQEYEEKERFRVTLEKICHEVCAADPERLPTISLEPFGSFRSGFATAGSDMDLVIVVKGNVSSSACFSLLEDDLPRALERRLLQLGYGARLLTRTRVPIIKVCEKPGVSFLDKLRDERWKWDDLPNEKKYPHLHPREEEEEEDTLAEGPNAPTMSVKTTSRSATESSNDQNSSAGTAVATNGTQSSEPGSVTPNTRLEAATDPQPEANGTNNSQKIQGENMRQEKPWTRERKAGPLDFPKDGVGIQSDINFFNPLGLHNTQLLRCYSICDLRVRPMVLFVKAWAKKRKINSSYSGTLSSYGYVLMVLHYLVNVANPPVLPNLQGRWVDKGNEAVVDGWSVHFRRDEEALATAAQRGQVTSNRESLGSLLNGFFQYYASVGVGGPNFRWMHEVLSLRSQGGLLTKIDKGWVKAVTEESEGKKVQHRYLFCIEDPFELDHNVARTVTHNGIVAIRDEFRRANRILFAIGNGNVPNDGELFADLVEVEDIWKATVELNKANGVKNGAVDGTQDTGILKPGLIPNTVLDQRAHVGNQHHPNANLNQSSRGGKKWKQHPQPQFAKTLDVHDNEAFPTLGAAQPSKKKTPRPREDGEEFSEISGDRAKAHLEEIKRMKDEAQAESTAKGAAEAVLKGID
jgi:terminal uridylyltransferase